MHARRLAAASRASEGFLARMPANKEERRGDRGDRKHPAPGRLPVPKLGNVRIGSIDRKIPHQPPVDELGGEDADYDRYLIERNQPAADARGSDFRDVQRRKARGESDGDSAEDSPGHESRERIGQRVTDPGHTKQHCGYQQQLFSPKDVAQCSAAYCADEAAE